MSRKRTPHRPLHTTPEIVHHVESTTLKDKKGKTPQLFQIPNNFSLWIAIFIVLIMVLLIIVGQTNSPTAQAPATLQLPSQESKPLVPGQGGMKLDAIPNVTPLTNK